MQTRVLTISLMENRLCSTDGTTAWLYFDVKTTGYESLGASIEIEAA